MTTERGGWPDGRREFGVVATAIMQVPGGARCELRARDIHARTEAMLGSQVSRHTVSDFLITYSGRTDGCVERVRHGHYRIRGNAPPDTRLGRSAASRAS